MTTITVPRRIRIGSARRDTRASFLGDQAEGAIRYQQV